ARPRHRARRPCRRRRAGRGARGRRRRRRRPARARLGSARRLDPRQGVARHAPGTRRRRARRGDDLMLFHLLYNVLARHHALSLLGAFRCPSTRIVGAAVTSLLLALLLGPWFIERLKEAQLGQQIRDDGPKTHLKKAGTPTMGGSLILLALVLPTILWCDLRNHFVWLTLAVTVGFGAVGFVDDWLKVSKRNTKGLAGKLKLAWEFAIAAAA